jgi:hypothetical protein
VSFRARQYERVSHPKRSAHNQAGLKERTITEADVYEFSFRHIPAVRRSDHAGRRDLVRPSAPRDPTKTRIEACAPRPPTRGGGHGSPRSQSPP